MLKQKNMSGDVKKVVFGVQVNRILHVKETVQIIGFIIAYFIRYLSGCNDGCSRAKYKSA